MGPQSLGGLLTAEGSKVIPDFKPGQSRQERPERGMKRHKWWPATGTSDAPSRESDTLKLRI
jgi:hypothetical protein